MEVFGVPLPIVVVILSVLILAGVGAAVVHTSEPERITRGLSSVGSRKDEQEIIRAEVAREHELADVTRREDEQRLERESLEKAWNNC